MINSGPGGRPTAARWRGRVDETNRPTAPEQAGAAAVVRGVLARSLARPSVRDSPTRPPPTSAGYTQLHDGRTVSTDVARRQEANELARNETGSTPYTQADRETDQQRHTEGESEIGREIERHVQRDTNARKHAVRQRAGGREGGRGESGGRRRLGCCCEAVIKSLGTDIEALL